MKLSNIVPNMDNPRTISREKLEKLKASLERSPKFMKYRQIIIDKDGKIIAGNQRYKGLLELGYKEVPDEWVAMADDFSEEEIREFIVLDNVSFGDWGYDSLLHTYTVDELEGYGLDLPDFIISPDGLNSEFNLPDGDRNPFQQMTFTFSDEQANYIREQITEARRESAFEEIEKFGNENKNGNALYFIITQWAGQRK